MATSTFHVIECRRSIMVLRCRCGPAGWEGKSFLLLQADSVPVLLKSNVSCFESPISSLLAQMNAVYYIAFIYKESIS